MAASDRSSLLRRRSRSKFGGYAHCWSRASSRSARGRASPCSREVPENRDVLYMIAVSQRYLQRIPEALQTLERLEQAASGITAACFKSAAIATSPCEPPQPAIEAYERAVTMNPALPASWSALQTLYRMAGTADGRRDGRAQRRRISQRCRTRSSPHSACSPTARSWTAERDRARVPAGARRPRRGHAAARARSASSSTCSTMPSSCSRACSSSRRTIASARYEYAHRAVEAAQARAGAARSSKSCSRCDPGNRAYRTDVCDGLRRTRRPRARRCQLLPRARSRRRPRRSGPAPVDRARPEDARADAQEAIDAYRRPPRCSRTSAMPTGASRISRPTASRTRKSRACAPRRPRRRSTLADRYHLCFALGKALEDRGRVCRVLRLLRARQCAQEIEMPLPPGTSSSATRGCRRVVCTRGVLRRARGSGLRRAARRSSSSACRAPARR